HDHHGRGHWQSGGGGGRRVGRPRQRALHRRRISAAGHGAVHRIASPAIVLPEKMVRSAAMIGRNAPASRSSRMMIPAVTGAISGRTPLSSITNEGGTCERGIAMHPTAAPTAAMRDDPSNAENTIS